MWSTLGAVGLLVGATLAQVRQVHTVNPDRLFVVDAAVGQPLVVALPEPCSRIYTDAQVVQAQHDSEQPHLVSLVLAPHQRPPTQSRVHLRGNRGASVSLLLRPVAPAHACSRLEFVYRPEAASQLAQALEEQAQRQAHSCAAQQAQLQARAERGELRRVLTRARAAFSSRAARRSGRNAALVVHVDVVRQLGEVAMLQLRVQNRRAQPVVLSAIEVWATPNQGPPARAPFFAEAAAPDAAAVAHIASAVLAPGASTQVDVAYALPPAARSLGVALHPSGPAHDAVIVTDIAL